VRRVPASRRALHLRLSRPARSIRRVTSRPHRTGHPITPPHDGTVSSSAKGSPVMTSTLGASLASLVDSCASAQGAVSRGPISQPVLHLIERIVGPLGLRVDQASPWMARDFRVAAGYRPDELMPDSLNRHVVSKVLPPRDPASLAMIAAGGAMTWSILPSRSPTRDPARPWQ
jgi:hypothetical protein